MAETAIQRSNQNLVQIAPNRSATDEWTYRPDVDVLDHPDSFQILADLPGATSESLNLTFENGVLTIQAEIAERCPQDARFLRQEFGVGNYHRRFSVGESVDHERIAASLTDGVLTVTLPKRQAAQRRTIQVRAG